MSLVIRVECFVYVVVSMSSSLVLLYVYSCDCFLSGMSLVVVRCVCFLSMDVFGLYLLAAVDFLTVLSGWVVGIAY